MAKSAAQILKEKGEGKAARQNFDSYWQTLHDYYDISGMEVNTVYTPGNELTVTNLFDTYSLETADILAAGLHNYLTPAASRWFGLRSRNRRLMTKKRVVKYYNEVEEEVRFTFNHSNYYNTIPEFYKKSGIYGTSILFEEEDPFDGIRFYSLPIKNVVIINDARGRVVEYHIEFEYTATQAVTRFGPDGVHPSVLKQHKTSRNPDEKHMYTLYIGPNWERNPQALDNRNKPWISQWIDDAHKTEILRGGFDELPALTHRFYERTDTPWGFSPAMKAFMDVKLLNAKAKTLMRSEMKLTDPPIALPENAFIQPYNGNPRGTNYYNPSKLKKDDIFAWGNYGNVAVGADSMEYSRMRVRSQMFTDVFQAFDGITKQMNNPEVFERIAEKMTLLGPAVGRFLTINDSVIHRTISLLGRQNKLPEPPPELREDPNYETEYLSILAKAQRNGELQSLQNAMVILGNLAAISPTVMDKIDPDKGVDAVWDITGAPVNMLLDDEEVQAVREGKQEAQMEARRAEMMGLGADIAVKATQAGKNVRETQAIGVGV